MDKAYDLIENSDLDEYIRVINSSNKDSVEIAAALLKMIRKN